jgi:nitrite reductase (NADH) large subunit
MSKQKMVVVGNGMAGARFVEELLRRGGGEKFDITLYGAEPRGNYNRILLSGVLGGTHRPESITLHSLEWYAEHAIDLRIGERVTRIDRSRRRVHAASGLSSDYDVLVLATGSRPLVPTMEGLSDPRRRPRGAYVMRTIEDCERIAEHAASCHRAVVVGGGLLGLEAARGLARFGARVTLVHRPAHLMNQQLDARGGQLLRCSIEAMGITVRTGASTEALEIAEVDGQAQVVGVRLEGGSVLPCEMVIFACGVAPRVELARSCGLPVERGIVVDDQMRVCGEEDIFAVGECAQHRGVCYGLVAPLWEQARVLADVLSGQKASSKYLGSRVATKLKVMGVEVASLGEVEAREDDEEVVYCEARRGVYKKLLIREGRLAGAILLGDSSSFATLQQSFERDAVLPEERAHLLWEIEGARASTCGPLPDEATVCGCNAVTKGAINNSIARGACSLEAIMKHTRAGTGCGGCKGQLKALLEAAPKAASADMPEPLAPQPPAAKRNGRASGHGLAPVA